jgi:DNA polymerase elongation subunit (family B)
LLTAFWDVAKHYDAVVTFNGRGFDVPFLYLRSAILNVPMPCQLSSSTEPSASNPSLRQGAHLSLPIDRGVSLVAK